MARSVKLWRPQLKSALKTGPAPHEVAADFEALDAVNAEIEKADALRARRALILQRLHGKGVALRKIATHTGRSPQTILNWEKTKAEDN